MIIVDTFKGLARFENLGVIIKARSFSDIGVKRRKVQTKTIKFLEIINFQISFGRSKENVRLGSCVAYCCKYMYHQMLPLHRNVSVFFLNVGFRHWALTLSIRFVDFKVLKSLEKITQTRERSVCMQIMPSANNGFVEDKDIWQSFKKGMFDFLNPLLRFSTIGGD